MVDDYGRTEREKGIRDGSRLCAESGLNCVRLSGPAVALAVTKRAEPSCTFWGWNQVSSSPSLPLSLSVSDLFLYFYLHKLGTHLKLLAVIVQFCRETLLLPNHLSLSLFFFLSLHCKIAAGSLITDFQCFFLQ